VIGGTAINTGTIRATTIREAVWHLSGVSVSKHLRVNYRVKEQITMARSLFPARSTSSKPRSMSFARNFHATGIEVVTGTASFWIPTTCK